MPEPEGAAVPLRLVLMGTGPFAVPSFAALQAAGHDCALVLTRPTRLGPGGKQPPPAPVRQWAEGLQLPVEAPESVNSAEAKELLAAVDADLFVVCDYGQILKREVLALAPLGGINLHGSLLPAFRGAAPVQWAVLSGARETGVSVIHMTPRLDAGPVLCRRSTVIAAHETAGELEARLAQLGVAATLEATALLAEHRVAVRAGGELPRLGEPQNQRDASKAPRLQKRDGRIDWSRAAEKIDCHVRGMQPWPTAFTELPAGANRKQPLRLVVRSVEPSAARTSGGNQAAVEPGTVHLDEGKLLVRCGDGWVRLTKLKPAGKREMSDEEWLRGRPLTSGEMFSASP
jgi:methionyl-tRNA formyltransferase